MEQVELLSVLQNIALGMAKFLGEDTEVVLHDLENPRQSVVYTANNTVTGRQVGQSFDRLVPQVILSDDLDNDMVTNYYFRTAEGKLVKSSTVLLRDFEGKVVGAMCINLDTTPITRQVEWLQALLPGIGEKRAQDIVAYREEHGPFETVDELDNVSGIGPGILEGLREYVSVESREGRVKSGE